MFEAKSIVKHTVRAATVAGVLVIGPLKTFAGEGEVTDTTTPTTVEVGAPPLLADTVTETTEPWNGVTHAPFPDFVPEPTPGTHAEFAVGSDAILPDTGIANMNVNFGVVSVLILGGLAALHFSRRR